MTALLQVQNLRRLYPRPRTKLFQRPELLIAVADASFTLNPGETLGIVGESGSGKSTLARMVMGFERPDSGTVEFDGTDLNAVSAGELQRLRTRFQMVFQDPYGSLDPRHSVGWSIAEPLRAAGQDNRPARVTEALEQVGLRPGDASKYPHEFSGGQRQRIAIARAIVLRPALIVADEAVSALDVSVQAQILNLLMDLQEDLGLAMLFISHDLAVVAAISDRLLVMKQGEILETGPTPDIFANPSHAYTRSLLKAAQFAPPRGAPPPTRKVPA